MPSFLLVVVVYKKDLLTARTLISLQQILSDAALASDFSLFIYDNSPAAQAAPSQFPIPVKYQNDTSNPGLATAYNAALAHAVRQSIPWLVLLDDDTSLNAAYLAELRSTAANTAIDIYVPHVVSGTRPLSPQRVLFARLAPVPASTHGLADFEVNAINSGSAIRTRVLEQIGGFRSDFPLDFLDYWLFHALHRIGATVWIGQAQLEHDLSVLDYERNVSFARYQSILESESRFIARYKGFAENVAYRLRLFARALKQSALSDKRFARLTLRAAFIRPR